MADDRTFGAQRDRRAPDPNISELVRRVTTLEGNVDEILVMVRRLDREQLVDDTRRHARTDAVKDIGKIILWVCAAATGLVGLAAFVRQVVGV